MRVIVAGAGIGGLSAALSLHAAGIDAVVIDAAASLRPLGVGINLMPHAVRELTELGLGDELEATGIPTAEMVHFDRHRHAARRPVVNAIVLACRDMPADRLLQLVSTRAPDGFDRVEDVLSAAELAAFDQAYRATTLPEVTALNSRPSLTP
jgi:glycine/D-amino acid oxidase-like deaminating enzyme